MSSGGMKKRMFGVVDLFVSVSQLEYEIVANGITIYTQNFGCEESFLTSCCANETTKRADVYSKSRHKDIWNISGCNRCGFTFPWGADSPGTAEVPSHGPTETGPQTIHLKIDLRRFLRIVLKNLKKSSQTRPLKS